MSRHMINTAAVHDLTGNSTPTGEKTSPEGQENLGLDKGSKYTVCLHCGIKISQQGEEADRKSETSAREERVKATSLVCALLHTNVQAVRAGAGASSQQPPLETQGDMKHPAGYEPS